VCGRSELGLLSAVVVVITVMLMSTKICLDLSRREAVLFVTICIGKALCNSYSPSYRNNFIYKSCPGFQFLL
jgi:hypothetical protein